MSSFQYRKSEAARLNQLIDDALEHLSKRQPAELSQLCLGHGPFSTAERVRRRATVLSRLYRTCSPAILKSRDLLILSIYAQYTPEGWFNGWCDGSTMRIEHGHRAGIGGIVMDPAYQILAQFAHRLTYDLDPLGVEIAALAALLQATLEHGATRIRVHTDCKALVMLWCQRRNDPRLAAVRTLAKAFRRVDLRLVPRLHNQLADKLAKSAALGKNLERLNLQDARKYEQGDSLRKSYRPL